MTDHWQGAIRQATEDETGAYCRDCIIEDGPDPDPLTDYGTTPVHADRADQNTRTLGDTLHVFGWVCEIHDTLCVRDIYEFEPPIDGLLVVTLESDREDNVVGHIPVHDLKRDRGRYYHPDNTELEYGGGNNQTSDPDTASENTPTGDSDTDDPPADPPAWINDYDHVVELTANNAPRSCHDCGDKARYYLTEPSTFVCAECDP